MKELNLMVVKACSKLEPKIVEWLLFGYEIEYIRDMDYKIVARLKRTDNSNKLDLEYFYEDGRYEENFI